MAPNNTQIPALRREAVIGIIWGFFLTALLALFIVIGSRNLAHFDAALVAYTFAVLFATFGLTYRYALWLQRPPTALYWKRGWQAFFKQGFRLRNFGNWFIYVADDLLLTRFIWRRDVLRGMTHALIMVGCILAITITFPLVFGWLHFTSLPDNLDWYRANIFGFPAFSFPVDSIFGFLLFHGLVWSSFLVIAGVMLAIRRRLREEGAVALQRFSEDFLPLFLLFAVSITGLMLTASYTWMKGYAYEFIAILHAITVIATFLWLPFGKFFHIFQRPAQIGVRFYKDVGTSSPAAHCRRCGTPFTSLQHVQDLIATEQALGYDYRIPNSSVEHYQWICPPCRRATFALAQGNLMADTARRLPGESKTILLPMPIYANPGERQGPLGAEDAHNFHP